MKLTYDPAHNIAYLRLRDPAGTEIQTIRISDEINIDPAFDGAVCGIERLNAHAQRGGAGGGRPKLDLAGRQVEVPLPEPA